MRLKEIIKFTEYVRPACLQTDGKDLPIYNMLYVVGWGWNGKFIKTLKKMNIR